MNNSKDATFLLACLGIVFLVTVGFFVSTAGAEDWKEEPRITVLSKGVSTNSLLHGLAAATSHTLVSCGLPDRGKNFDLREVPLNQALKTICGPLGIRVFPNLWLVSDPRILKNIPDDFQLRPLAGTERWGTLTFNFAALDVRELLQIIANKVKSRGVGNFRLDSSPSSADAKGSTPTIEQTTKWQGGSFLIGQEVSIGLILNAICLAYHGSPGELRDGVLTCVPMVLPRDTSSASTATATFAADKSQDYEFRLGALIGFEGSWGALLQIRPYSGLTYVKAGKKVNDLLIHEVSEKGILVKHLESGMNQLIALGVKFRHRADGNGLETLP